MQYQYSFYPPEASRPPPLRSLTDGTAPSGAQHSVPYREDERMINFRLILNSYPPEASGFAPLCRVYGWADWPRVRVELESESDDLNKKKRKKKKDLEAALLAYTKIPGTPVVFFFFPSHLLSSPFLLFSLLVVTQIRGHIAGSSPPLPTTVRALHFFREISALSSLVDSRRIELTPAGRSRQLILFLF